MDDPTRLRLADDVTFQSMGDGEQTVVLSLTTGVLFTCNDTTARLLAAIDGERTFAEIVDLLVAEYDVPRPKLHTDLAAMAHRLLDKGLIAATPQ